MLTTKKTKKFKGLDYIFGKYAYMFFGGKLETGNRGSHTLSVNMKSM